ncbi:MAG TPA: rod shape-determining protein MreC [Candidatus Dormibacteraeota bacterium]
MRGGVRARTGERSTGAFLLAASALIALALITDLPAMAGPRGALRGILAPPEAVMSALAAGAGDVAGVFGDIASLRSANGRLRAENADLRRQVALGSAAARENDQLRRALAFEKTYGHKVVAASVIARSPEPLSRSLTIDKGSSDGLSAGMVVASPAGLVGRIVETSSHSALIQTIADPQSRVNGYGALSGLEGTVLGDGVQLTMQVPARPDSGLKPGEWVLSSGVGGTYPRGLVVGQVVSFQPQAAATLQYATLAWPDDYSSLDLVLVITDFQSPVAP